MNATLEFWCDTSCYMWRCTSGIYLLNICHYGLKSYLPKGIAKTTRLSIYVTNKKPVRNLKNYHEIKLSHDGRYWFGQGEYQTEPVVIYDDILLFERLNGGLNGGTVWIYIKPIL